MDGDGSCVCSGGGSECLAAGDGISVLRWFHGWNLPTAIEFVATHLGIKPKEKRQRTLEEEVVPQDADWRSVGPMFRMHNYGINEKGMERCGVTLARHRSQSVIAIPGLGEDLKSITNYVLMGWSGPYVEMYDQDGKVVNRVRKKTVKKGVCLIGGPMESLGAEGFPVVWKTEGPTDAMALAGVIPDGQWGQHVVVSNCHGAGERPGWMAGVLAKAKLVYLVHDPDSAGTKGAERWAKEIARAGGQVRVVELPDGEDLRKFIHKHGDSSFGRLLTLAEKATEVQSDINESNHHETNGNGSIPAEDASILRDLMVDVLFEDDKGAIHVYAMGARKSAVIRNIDKLTRETAMQHFGPVAKMLVASDPSSPESGQVTIKQVKQAIAIGASGRRVDSVDDSYYGSGVWEEGECVVCCNRGHLSIWDGETWRESESPRFGEKVWNLSGVRWYDHETMGGLLEQAKSAEWCESVIDRLTQIMWRWTWRNPTDPRLLSLLAASTFCQTVWGWRPQVSIRGETNSGKTAFLNLLFGGQRGPGIFGALAFNQSISSAAGIRQSIRKNAYCIAIDEWDSMNVRRRAEMLDLLRTSGPATTIVLGSQSQKAKEFGMRHLVWLAGIHVGLDAAPDANRYLEFDLRIPDAAKWGAWKFPSAEERADLGRELLALAIVHCRRASAIVDEAVKLSEATGTHDRILRMLCCPAALQAAYQGQGPVEVAKYVDSVAKYFSSDQSSSNHEPTHFELLRECFELNVSSAGGMKYPAASILSPSADFTDSTMEDQLQSQCGMKACKSQGQDWVAIHPGKVARYLDMTRSSVQQILLRIEGTQKQVVKMNGSATRVVIVPWQVIEQTIYSTLQQ